jgi:ribonucleoside-diphosphate reductase alpha chain
VPVESLVRKFEHVRFEPSGMTRNPEIPIAKSLVDYIFRWLAMEFVPGYRAINAPKRPGKEKPEEETGETANGRAGDAGNSQPVTRNSKNGGNGHGHRVEPDSAKPFDYDETENSKLRTQNSSPKDSPLRVSIVADPLSQQGADMQSDAPACDVCGSITVRSGTCYKCLNCGNSMGCS